MYFSSTILRAATTALLLGSVAQAQESPWQNSYQYEASARYAEAMNAIDFVPANGPEGEFRLMRRGWLLYQAGRHDESIREYRLAVERNPKSVDARLGLILPFFGAKRWRDAEMAARAALEIVPNHYTALLRLAQAQEAQQDWNAMSKTAATLVALYGTDATAHLYLARAHAWLGHKSDATAEYTAVLVRYPTQQEAKAWLAGK